jgi:hypothetical protein
MTEKQEYYGTWWIPGYPDEQVAGILSFVPFKIATLKLIGSLRYRIEERQGYYPAIILGSCSHGGKVTLYQCGEQKIITDPNSGEQRVEEFWAHTVFIGAHFCQVEDIQFKRIIVHYPYLTQWTNLSGLSSTPSKSDPDGANWTINCNFPEPVHAAVSDRWSLFLDPIRSIPVLPPVVQDITIKQLIVARIECVEETVFEEYMQIMHLLGDFLSLGTLKVLYPTTIEGETASHPVYVLGSDEPLDIDGRYYTIAVSYSRTENNNNTDDIDGLTNRKMLFTFEDIVPQFEEFLQNWFSKHGVLEPIYNIFFGNLRMPRLYSEYELLTSVQALESYHRRAMNNHVSSEEEHRTRLSSILGRVPEEHREWLETKLKHSNEPPLRSRLWDIIQNSPEGVKRIIGSNRRERETFAYKVAATRNYLTHYSPEAKNDAFKQDEFFTVVRKLNLLLIVCLLKEIGFSMDKIDELIERNRNWHYYFRIEEGFTVTW